MSLVARITALAQAIGADFKALGTAARKNTGTSGDAVPLLNGANTWSALQSFGVAKAKVIHFADGGYFNAGNSGAANTINFANGHKQLVTLTANCTITLTAPGPGNYQLLLLQDATGGRSVTWAVPSPGSVLYVGSALAPPIYTAANGWTVVSIFWDGASAFLAASKVNAA